ncbi:hypothetical protein GQ54DRAFT_307470 [Martensiomyces pterosporus]|nr:hypothetical protein GQ54DRAFT_307470 [Martensiomyces pterosporus]
MARYYVLAHSHRIFGRETRKNPVTPSNLVVYLFHLQSMSNHGFWQNSDSQASPRQHHDTDNFDSRIRSPIPALVSKVDHPHVRSTNLKANANQEIAADERSSQQQPLDTNKAEVAPFAEPPDTAHVGERLQDQHSMPHEHIPAVRLSLKATWSRRIQSDRFAAWVFVGFLAIMVVLMIILNIFAKEMALRPLHYNCTNGWEFYPISVITGIFNVIICPAYVILIWSYRDAYGIRNSICISFTLGTLMWAGAIIWRFIAHDIDTYISASLFFLAQIVSVYTYFIVIPTIVSIRFGRKQRRGSLDTERAQEDGIPGGASDQAHSQGSLSKQSFLAAMQDTSEHEKIRRFANSCFCTELVSFLDVYLAFKASIYLDIQDGIAQAALISQNHHDRGSADLHSPPPSIATAKSSRGSLEDAPLRSSPHSSKSHKSTDRMHHAKSQRHLKLLLSSKESHVQRKRESRYPEPKQIEAAEAKTPAIINANLASLAVGIAESMAHAFPHLGITSGTLVSENLRIPLSAIIRTFILPESPLAINTSSNVVASSRKYLTGGQVAFGLLDGVKDEIVSLLYSNVYLRYRQA